MLWRVHLMSIFREIVTIALFSVSCTCVEFCRSCLNCLTEGRCLKFGPLSQKLFRDVQRVCIHNWSSQWGLSPIRSHWPQQYMTRIRRIIPENGLFQVCEHGLPRWELFTREIMAVLKTRARLQQCLKTICFYQRGILNSALAGW